MSRTVERNCRFPNVVLSEQDIEEVLRRGVDSKVLDFSGANLAGDQPFFIADSITSNKRLSFVHVDLSCTKITAKGFDAVLGAACELKVLENLIARDNDLSKDVGLAISKLIGSKGILKVLDLSGNRLGDIGVGAVAGIFGMALPPQDLLRGGAETVSLFTLTVLDLSNNDFGDMGVLALCRGLTQLVKHTAGSSRNPALKILRLNSNKIGDKAALCLAQLLNRKGALTPRSPTYRHSVMSSGGAVTTASQFVLSLDELWLNDNSALTAKGICALLGNAAEGVSSPLKKLCVARCRPSIAVLEHLAANLKADCPNALETLDLDFTESVAAEVVSESGSRFGKMENSYSGYCCLSAALKLLVDALQINKQNSVNNTTVAAITCIDLGALPKATFTACVSAVASKQVSAYQDAIKALDSLNSGGDVFHIPYISHIKGWVTNARYDNREYHAPRPVAPPVVATNTFSRSANGASSVPLTLTPPGSAKNGKSSFLNNLHNQLSDSPAGNSVRASASKNNSVSPKQPPFKVTSTTASSLSPKQTAASGRNGVMNRAQSDGNMIKQSLVRDEQSARSPHKIHSAQDLLAAPVMTVGGGSGQKKSEDKAVGRKDVSSGKLNTATAALREQMLQQQRQAEEQQRQFEALMAEPLSQSKQRADAHNGNGSSSSDVKEDSFLNDLSGRLQQMESTFGDLVSVKDNNRDSNSNITNRNNQHSTHSTVITSSQLEVEEQQYLQMRINRSTALHTLASEIQLLAEKSPSKEDSSASVQRSNSLFADIAQHTSSSNYVSNTNTSSATSSSTAGTGLTYTKSAESYSDHNNDTDKRAATALHSAQNILNNQHHQYNSNNKYESNSSYWSSSTTLNQISHHHSNNVMTDKGVMKLSEFSGQDDYSSSAHQRQFNTSPTHNRNLTGQQGHQQYTSATTPPNSNKASSQPSRPPAISTVGGNGLDSYFGLPASVPPSVAQSTNSSPDHQFSGQLHGGHNIFRNLGPMGTHQQQSQQQQQQSFPHQSHHHHQPQQSFPRETAPAPVAATLAHAQRSAPTSPSRVRNTGITANTSVADVAAVNEAYKQEILHLQAQLRALELRHQTTEHALLVRVGVIESRIATVERVSHGTTTSGATDASENDLTKSLQNTVEELSGAVAKTNKLLSQQAQQQRVSTAEVAQVHKSLSQRIVRTISNGRLTVVDNETNHRVTALAASSSPSRSVSYGPESAFPRDNHYQQQQQLSNSHSESVIDAVTSRLEHLEATVMHDIERHDKQQHRHEMIERLQHVNESQQQQQSHQQSHNQHQQNYDHNSSAINNTSLRERRGRTSLQQVQVEISPIEDEEEEEVIDEYAEEQLQNNDRYNDNNHYYDNHNDDDLALTRYEFAPPGPANDEYNFQDHRHHYHFTSSGQRIVGQQQHHTRAQQSPPPPPLNSLPMFPVELEGQQHHRPVQSQSQSAEKRPHPPSTHSERSTATRSTPHSVEKDRIKRSRVFAAPELTAAELEAREREELFGPKYSDDPALVNPPLFQHQQAHTGTVRLHKGGASYLRSIKAVPALPALPLLPAESFEHEQQHLALSSFSADVFDEAAAAAARRHHNDREERGAYRAEPDRNHQQQARQWHQRSLDYEHQQQREQRERAQQQQQQYVHPLRRSRSRSHEETDLPDHVYDSRNSHSYEHAATLATPSRHGASAVANAANISHISPTSTGQRPARLTNRDLDLLVAAPRPFKKTSANKNADVNTNTATVPEYRYETLQPSAQLLHARPSSGATSTESLARSHGGSNLGGHTTNQHAPLQPHNIKATRSFMQTTAAHQTKLWAKAHR